MVVNRQAQAIRQFVKLSVVDLKGGIFSWAISHHEDTRPIQHRGAQGGPENQPNY